jgi:4a-hydroxytetrahydrobiopterin dehydratase
MSNLAAQPIQTIKKDTPLFNQSDLTTFLNQLPHWQTSADQKIMFREFRFSNYYQTISFVNALAWIAHQADHHPDLEVGYNRCLVKYSTHTINALSINDFICAARIDKLDAA